MDWWHCAIHSYDLEGSRKNQWLTYLHVQVVGMVLWRATIYAQKMAKWSRFQKEAVNNARKNSHFAAVHTSKIELKENIGGRWGGFAKLLLKILYWNLLKSKHTAPSQPEKRYSEKGKSRQTGDGTVRWKDQFTASKRQLLEDGIAAASRAQTISEKYKGLPSTHKKVTYGEGVQRFASKSSGHGWSTRYIIAWKLFCRTNKVSYTTGKSAIAMQPTSILECGPKVHKQSKTCLQGFLWVSLTRLTPMSWVSRIIHFYRGKDTSFYGFDSRHLLKESKYQSSLCNSRRYAEPWFVEGLWKPDCSPSCRTHAFWWRFEINHTSLHQRRPYHSRNGVTLSGRKTSWNRELARVGNQK